jgi:hypothetical protein
MLEKAPERTTRSGKHGYKIGVPMITYPANNGDTANGNPVTFKGRVTASSQPTITGTVIDSAANTYPGTNPTVTFQNPDWSWTLDFLGLPTGAAGQGLVGSITATVGTQSGVATRSFNHNTN